MAGRRAPNMRARDADRSEVCGILDAALVEGQLTGEEHRQRVAAATGAKTLGELENLTTDLQAATPTGTPRPALRRRVPVAIAGVGVVIAAVVIAVVVATSGSDAPPAPSAPSPAPVAESPVAPTEPADPAEIEPSVVAMPTEFHTVEGMTALLDSIRQRFGSTTGIELAIWRADAMLLLPDPSNPTVKYLYRFDDGWGDPSSRPRDPEDDPTDLGAFDVAAVVDALRVAPEAVGIPPADVSDLVVDIDQLHDPAGAGALELMVKVSSTSGGSGFVYLDRSGAVKNVERAG